MKRNEAIQRLAAILKEQAENAVSRAQISLGDHGTIVPEEVDYTLKATELLDDNIVEAAFNLAVYGNAYGSCAASAATPPLPSAPRNF